MTVYRTRNCGSFPGYVFPVLCGIAASLAALVATGQTAAQITETKPPPPIVSVVVDAGRPGEKTSAMLFGSFLEPIGHSINGGISAQILINPSFEGGLWNHVNLENIFREQPELIASSDQTGIPLPWEPLNFAAGNRYDLHVGSAANSWQSLEILGAPGQLTGIQQKVYLPVQRTLGYNVSLYAKHISGPTQLTVSLRSRESGKALASATVDAAASGWTKYSAVLKLPPGTVRRLEPVDFALAVEGDARIEVDEFSLLPDDAIGTLDPDEVAMAKAMHPTELRFGGNFSSYYNWRDGIGPVDKRVTMKNIAWGIPEYNDFGTDEFLKLCTLIHAIPQFDLNMGSGTPEEAAAWVRYIRAHYDQPVLYEIGNELYGRWRLGYPTLSQLPARTLAFSRAVKAVDPKATIIATGQTPEHFEQWNAAELSNPPGTFDALSTHFIEGTNHPQLPQATPDFTAAAAYATTYAVGKNFDAMQAQVNAVPGMKDKVHFGVTEWLFNSKGYGERNFTDEGPSWVNAGGAVMAGGFLNTIIRHSAEIKIADMTGIMEFAGIWKKDGQVYASPAYYVFQMYATAKGGTSLPVTTDSGAYSIANGIPSIPEAKDVPYVDAVALRSADGKTLTVYCVNRSLNRDLPVRLSLRGFAPAPTAEVEQMHARDRYEENDEVEPQHVVPIPSTLTLDNPDAIEYELPRESVTMLRFHARD